MYVIGVDIGTQGTKAALFSGKFERMATAFEPSKLCSPEPGIVWQEPEDIYGSVVRTIKELMDKSGIAAKQVGAVGIDGQMAGIMGIDKDGEAATCYDSWLDVRSNVYVKEMEREAGERIRRLSGGQVTGGHASKILWWKRNHPRTYDKICKFVLPHGYVVNKMTGNKAEKAVFDHTCLHFNSFSDNKDKRWSSELLRQFGVGEEKMPRIASPFEVIGGIAHEFAELSGLAAGTPVVAGAGDSAASAFGSGMFERDMLQDCAGTASILCSVVDGYVPDTAYKTLVMMRSPVDGLWNPLAYVSGGGLCIRWVRDRLSGSPPKTYDELESQAAHIPPGSEGLLFCPHFAGRILPSQPEMKGAFWGLDFSHTVGHIYRAVLEGIAYEYSYFLSVMKHNYPDCSFKELYSIGGGAGSPLFGQIKSDVLGLPVQTYANSETALLGSAVIAAYGTGMISDYRSAIRENAVKKKRHEPDAGNHKRYEEEKGKYLTMLNMVSQVESAAGKEQVCWH